MNDPGLPLFCYSLEIPGGREFLIEVDHDGTIHWDDYRERRRLRHPSDENLEIGAMLGSQRARLRLASESAEFAVSFALPPDVLARIREAVEMEENGQWTAAHETELDKILLPLFWSDVNPYITSPINPPA